MLNPQFKEDLSKNGLKIVKINSISEKDGVGSVALQGKKDKVKFALINAGKFVNLTYLQAIITGFAEDYGDKAEIVILSASSRFPNLEFEQDSVGDLIIRLDLAARDNINEVPLWKVKEFHDSIYSLTVSDEAIIPVRW